MRKFFTTIILFFVLHTSHAQITWDTTQNNGRRHRADGYFGTFKPSIKASVFYRENIGLELTRVK